MQFTIDIFGMLFLCILRNSFFTGADGLWFTQYLFILLCLGTASVLLHSFAAVISGSLLFLFLNIFGAFLMIPFICLWYFSVGSLLISEKLFSCMDVMVFAIYSFLSIRTMVLLLYVICCYFLIYSLYFVRFLISAVLLLAFECFLRLFYLLF